MTQAVPTSVSAPGPNPQMLHASIARPRLRLTALSYRHKIPLAVSFVIVVTALFVSTALAFQSWRDVKRDVAANAESLGRTLSRALGPVMLRDDLWSAYETVTTP